VTDQNDDQPKPARGVLPERLEELQHVADWFNQPDSMLQTLADVANAGGSAAGMGITLYLPSGVMSGFIQSAQDFYRAIADQYRNAVADNADDGEVPEWASDFARMFFEERATRVDEGIDEDSQAFKNDGTKTTRWAMTQALHLKDAHHIAPGQAESSIGHTRVNLNQIAAWHLGQARTTKQP
jgi:hypothetical protein